MRNDLGELNDLEAVDRLISVDGLNLIDAGCAGGDTARALADRGAIVLGVEPDPVQAAKNKEAPAHPNVTLAEAGAEALPAEDNSADGVFFFRSLHHVPREQMDHALCDAARVLKADGFLYVVEPSMEGSQFAMMRPFHDETEVRTLAQESLARAAELLFAESEKYVYVQHSRHENFETMKARFSGMSFNDIDQDKIDQPEVRSHFERAKTDDGYVFDQPMLVNLYRRVKS